MRIEDAVLIKAAAMELLENEDADVPIPTFSVVKED